MHLGYFFIEEVVSELYSRLPLGGQNRKLSHSILHVHHKTNVLIGTMEPIQIQNEPESAILSNVNLELLVKNLNFVIAIRDKNVELVKQLLNEVDVNFVNMNHDQNTPLHYAVASGEPEVVDLLLDKKALKSTKVIVFVS